MKRTVLSGVAWVGSAMTLVRVARYIALLILAGLLSPGNSVCSPPCT